MSIIHCQIAEVSIPITCSCQRAYFASGVLMGFEVNESMCLGGAALGNPVMKHGSLGNPPMNGYKKWEHHRSKWLINIKKAM